MVTVNVHLFVREHGSKTEHIVKDVKFYIVLVVWDYKNKIINDKNTRHKGMDSIHHST